jgi:coenzyme F420 hydrogenase subunit beta
VRKPPLPSTISSNAAGRVTRLRFLHAQLHGQHVACGPFRDLERYTLTARVIHVAWLQSFPCQTDQIGSRCIVESTYMPTPRESLAAISKPEIGPAAPRGLCTDCGVSRMSDPKACGRACQFIKPDYAAMEAKVHGRPRDAARPDEVFFGPFRRMLRAAMKTPLEGAQWTGITTRLAARLLETGAVQAVLTMAPDPNDSWRPVPVLVTDAAGMAEVRGMRMGYAPLLALLEPAQARGFKRIAIIGIPCQVHALRALEKELGFERLYVIGTPCSDNTTTENFHSFLALLAEDPATITYLEFRADYHVELRFKDGGKKEIPFLLLPISKLPPDFFPLTCRTCVDYTNALADITVGYMGGEGEQWLLVRNERGEEMLSLLGDEITVSAPGSKGKRAGAVAGFIKNVERAAGGLPLRGMPNWLRPIIGWLMPRIGPRGLEFARTRVEMKAAETVLHLRRQHPARMRNMIPAHVWDLLKPYGILRNPGE